MILGVDFDNTLVCYDNLFYAAAVARDMMPPDGPRHKRCVRDWFIAQGREDDFTLLQGEVYGRSIQSAKPYSGAHDCLAARIAAGTKVYVISHKTRVPVRGQPYDLWAAAAEWLVDNGFIGANMLGRNDVFFEETLEGKAIRISLLGCTHFIDDMARFLLHPRFPSDTEGLLFSPSGSGAGREHAVTTKIFPSWAFIADYLGGICHKETGRVVVHGDRGHA